MQRFITLQNSTARKPNWPFNEQYEEDDMSSRDLTPMPFSGLKTEDAEDWLGSVAFWLRYRKLTDDAAIATIALLLRGGAQQWFRSLECTEKWSVEQFVKEFTKRYITNQISRWEDMTAVFEVKQLPGQQFEDFIALVQKLGKRAHASPDQLMAAIVKGLRPYIRQ